MQWFANLAKALDLMARFSAIYAVLQSVSAKTSPAAAYQPAANVILSAGSVKDVIEHYTPEERELVEKGLPVCLRLLDAYMEK